MRQRRAVTRAAIWLGLLVKGVGHDLCEAERPPRPYARSHAPCPDVADAAGDAGRDEARLGQQFAARGLFAPARR